MCQVAVGYKKNFRNCAGEGVVGVFYVGQSQSYNNTVKFWCCV